MIQTTPRKYYYTGDTYNPMVAIVKKNGFRVPHGSVKLTITKPGEGTGNLLSKTKFENVSTEIDGDILPARISALKKLESSLNGKPLITYSEQSVEMRDDGLFTDGAMEPDGIFGVSLPDLFRQEGHYTFRAVGEWGDGCHGTRELTWSVHVLPGIDSRMTDMTIRVITALPGGKQKVRVTITPKDKYGNLIGPGRLDAIDLTAVPGTVITGGTVKDEGNGSYSVTAEYDPASGNEPGVVISQPGRPPVLVAPKGKSRNRCVKYFWWIALLLLIILALLVALVIK
jgi:hypothetical protein